MKILTTFKMFKLFHSWRTLTDMLEDWSLLIVTDILRTPSCTDRLLNFQLHNGLLLNANYWQIIEINKLQIFPTIIPAMAGFYRTRATKCNLSSSQVSINQLPVWAQTKLWRRKIADFEVIILCNNFTN